MYKHLYMYFCVYIYKQKKKRHAKTLYCVRESEILGVQVRYVIEFTRALSQTRKLTHTHTHILRLRVSVPAPGCEYVCVHMY